MHRPRVCFCNILCSYGLAGDKPNAEHVITISDGARACNVTVSSSLPDAVVWNPWVAKAKARSWD